MVDIKSSSVWSVEEDAELARLQELHGNRWALVAAELSGKTGQQCAQRWRHKVNPAIKKEKWTPEEDAQLARLYSAHGQRWAEIARHLEGRTDQQCMGRWRRHLDPSVKKDAWADAEDGQLVTLHDTLGPRWSNISKMLTGRTAQQCRARWFQLSATEDDGAELSEEVLSSGDAPTVAAAAAGASGGRGNKPTRDAKNRQHFGGGGGRGGKGTPPPSLATPAVTDESQQDGAVAGGGGGGSGGGTSTERAGPGGVFDATAGERSTNTASSKRRKTLKDVVANKGGGGPGSSGGGCRNGVEDGGSSWDPKPSADAFGAGGGLDMLAMLYSAAVTYEQGFFAAAAGGLAGSGAAAGMPAELQA